MFAVNPFEFSRTRKVSPALCLMRTRHGTTYATGNLIFTCFSIAHKASDPAFCPDLS